MKLAQSVKAFAKLRAKTVPDSHQTRELILCARIGEQVAEANIEEPEQFKSLFLYAEALDTATITFSVEERVYKLERDEEAMLKRIANTNIKAMGVDAFLYDRLGGTMGELNARADEAKGKAGETEGLSGQAQMSLDAVMDKKKVFQETKVIAQGQPVSLAQVMGQQLESMGLSRSFEVSIDAKTKVRGAARLCCNAFTAMPKGSFSLTIEDKSDIMKVADSSTPDHTVLAKVEGLVMRVSKQVSLDGDRLLYRVSDHELKKRQQLDFDSAFFDDTIKI